MNLSKTFFQIALRNITLGQDVSGVDEIQNSNQSYFSRTEDLVNERTENITNKIEMDINNEPKIPLPIPEHLIGYYTTNFSSNTSRIREEKITFPTPFLTKENDEIANDGNTTNKIDLEKKNKLDILPHSISEDMIGYYITNFTSTDAVTSPYGDEVPTGRRTDPPYDKHGYDRQDDEPYPRGDMVMKHKGYPPPHSYHSKLVPVVIKKTPLYFPGLNNYYRKMNIQRRPGARRASPASRV